MYIKNRKQLPIILAGIVIGGGLSSALFITVGHQFFGKKLKDFSVDPYVGIEAAPQTPPAPLEEKIPSEVLKSFLEKVGPENSKEDSFINRNVQLVSNPTKEETGAYIQQVEAGAVVTSSVTIDECMPEPVVVKVTEGNALQFINRGARDHFIFIENERIDLPAGTLTEVEARFISGVGIYNYDCDTHFSVGTIWVVE